MLVSYISAFLLIAIPAAAATASPPTCIDLVVPVHVDTQSYPPIFPPLKNGYEAVEFLIQGSGRDADPDTTKLLGKPENISTTFSISTTYCTPCNPGAKASTVQLLTHGLGFDRAYWDLEGLEYNYIASATAAGYSTFSYDRLGNGASTIADPYTTVQTVVELAILTKLTTMLRAGTISPKIPASKKVVHIGHSYGSLLSNGIAAKFPNLSDAVVLTGYSLNTTYQRWWEISTAFHLASENQPARFANFSSGYLTWGDKYYNQYGFLKAPYFNVSVLEKAEDGKNPFTLGELITFPLVPYLAPKFSKPVLLMAADSDLIFCGGDCHGIVDGPTSATPEVFSAAKPLEVYIQPNSGHGMNLHYNASGWYAVVQDFLGKNGL